MRSGHRRAGATQTSARVLLVDRHEEGYDAIRSALGECFANPLDIVRSPDGRGAAELLRAGDYDIVLLELSSTRDLGSIEEGVARLARLADGALLVALSPGGSVTAAVAAMRAGAHDYLPLPITGTALASRLIELSERHGKVTTLTLGGNRRRSGGFAGFVGESSQMQFVYEQIERIAPSAAPVFITGEGGSGKDVCAEALHNHGPRAGRRFVTVNCAAIPRDLMEAELFGVTRGAFTGAQEDRAGAAELSDGGTLFLDEIGELDLSVQAKLLRFLQTGAVSRVGDATIRRVDVRVVCATSRNPMQLIASRRFREDLFYRLHVLPIHLPPLRQRGTDVLVLARHFLARFAAEERKRFSGFDAGAAEALLERGWPGNVRQLQNVVRRIVIMFDGGEVTVGMLDAADIERNSPAVESAASAASQEPTIRPMWRQEQQIIEDAIRAFGGNVALAAAALELSPSTIYRKRQAWAELDGKRGAA